MGGGKTSTTINTNNHVSTDVNNYEQYNSNTDSTYNIWDHSSDINMGDTTLGDKFHLDNAINSGNGVLCWGKNCSLMNLH